MSSIPRSKSAPHVGTPLQPFLAPTREPTRPQLPRHRTSLALTELITPSQNPPRSGHHTPRSERAEDPFSLGGFFPSPFPLAENRLEEDEEWQWLRRDDDRVPEEQAVEEWKDSNTEVPPLDESEDEETDELIRQEDKLGILSIPAIFASKDMETASAYDHLFVPHAAESPADDDALFESYHALRQAYCASMWTGVDNNVRLDGVGLFAPPLGAKGEQGEGDEYRSAFAQKMSVLLGMSAL